MASQIPYLDVQNLTKRFGAEVLFDNISFSIAEGQKVGLVARNFGPIMATAAKTTIVEVSQLVALGDLDPENIITPGIFVQRVFSLENLTAAQRA